MTAQATRDALAVMDGWTRESDRVDNDGFPIFEWWRWNSHPTLKSRTWCRTHPHPPTLDGADAAVPEGWTWSRANGVWHGWHEVCTKACGCVEPSVPDTGDKIADLYALALCCRKAMEEK